MNILLTDGARYREWTDLKETEDLEPMVAEHSKDIFGENAFYFDRKQKLHSLSGIGSIPDGYIIVLGDQPHWHIVEVELSSHQIHDHIVSQVGKFISGVKNPHTQREITNAIYNEIINDLYTELEFKQASGCRDVHKFLADLINQPPALTIVIDKVTDLLTEALDVLNHSPIKVVEFRTFRREEAENVHIHLFEPFYKVKPGSVPIVIPPLNPPQGGKKASKVTFEELVKAGLLSDGQVLYFYQTKLFNNEQAKVIASSNQLEYEKDGQLYSKSGLAALLGKKYGFIKGDYPVQGPMYWKTEDGQLLYQLEDQVRKNRQD